MTVPVTGADAARRRYDAIVVGSGWAGSLIAEHLGGQGWRVLMLEAGSGGTETWDGYQDILRTFSSAVAKVPNSAYRPNAAAPSPDVLDLSPGGTKGYTADGYFVQNGALPYRTDYLRALGGAGMHWMGTTPRMHPDDFATRTNYGYGRDWPLTAPQLEPYLAKAERAIGVSGDADEQRLLGAVTDPSYVFPMHPVPTSYLDGYCHERLDGQEVEDEVAGEKVTLRVHGMPQGRNSTPDPRYADGAGYRPQGAVGLPNYGERCVGNSSCTPICPVQAKASPPRVQARTADSVALATRCVVSRVLPGREGYVRGVEYRAYADPASPVSTAYSVEADVVVLAAHAIENARLLLASGLANSSDQVGRNLMDHPTPLAWARAADHVGPFRGPGQTSGLASFRFGPARRKRAPFHVEIYNWGWGWSTGAPNSNVSAMLQLGGDRHGEVLSDGLFGPALRARLGDEISRQVSVQFAVEQSADPANRVTIDPRRHRDALGDPVPVITYDLDGHTRDGIYAARKVSEEIFARLGAVDFTDNGAHDGVYPVGHFRHRAAGSGPELDLVYQGAGHGAGTHIMGTDPRTSVVDPWQRTHDHPNLYATGCGSMPSLGTSNPTLTMSALALRSAERIHRDLAALHQPVVVRAGTDQKQGAAS